MMPRLALAAALLALLTTLNACGNKGPLQRPPKDTAKAASVPALPADPSMVRGAA